MAQMVKLDFTAAMQQRSQVGFDVPSSVEHVAMEARTWHGLGGVLVQLDCENASISVDRAAMEHVSGLEYCCPALLPLCRSIEIL